MPAPTKDSAARRHKFTSLAAKSKAQHINIVKKQIDFTNELEASSSTLPPSLLPSPFSLHLAHLSLLNLSLPFQALHKKLDPLTTTFPLLLFNAKEVIHILTEVLSDPDEPEAGGHGAIPAVLELLPPLAQSLLDAFLPHLNEILPPLLSLANSPFHLPLLFPSISGLLKPLSPLLLLPSNKHSLIETWKLWKTFLVMVGKGGQSAGEEQRRLAVEGWGSIVRRGGRGEGGERLIRIMIEDLVVEEEEGSVGLKDGVCLVLVEGMKGPNATLHSRTPHLLDHLLTLLLPQPISSTLPTSVLPNILTALIHHVHSKPQGYEPVLEVLEKSAKKELEVALLASNAQNEVALTRLGRSLKSVVVVAAVRKGRCVTATYLPRFLTLLPPLLTLVPTRTSSSSPLQSLYLSLLSTLLPIGKLPDWLSNRHTVESFWSTASPSSRKSLVGVFVDEQDGGWRGGGEVLVKPLVEKETLGQLTSEPGPVLELLRCLAKAGILEKMSNGWKETLAGGLGVVLKGLDTMGEFQNESIPLLITLLPLLPPLSPHRANFLPSLTNILRLLLSSSSPSTFDSTPANESFALGSVLSTLGEMFDRGSDGSEEVVEMLLESKDGKKEVERVLERWSTRRVLLQGLGKLMSSLSGSFDSLSLSTLLPYLSSHILSEDSSIRQSSLLILSVVAPSSIVLQRCIELEDVPLTVRDAREKCLRVGKVARAVVALGGKPSKEGEVEIEVGVKILVAQLKVNLRPLWPETCKALAEVSAIQASVVWSIIFSEISEATKGDRSLFVDALPEWSTKEIEDEETAGVEGLPVEEEEKTFRDPWRRRSEERVAREMGGEESKLREMGQFQITTDRLDVLNYEMELLHALAAAPSKAEQHSRDLVPIFLAFARPVAVDSSEDLEASPDAPRMSQRLVHLKLIAFLELFAKIKGPKSLYRSEELHSLYLDLLAKGEIKIQKLAFECILTYKSIRIMPYKDNLMMLLDDVRFRDQLAKFSLSYAGDSIDPTHRQEIIPLVIRLLYGLMITRRGRASSSQGPTARKQAILASFAGCTTEELGTLVGLMLGPFGALEAKAGPSSGGFAFSEESSFLPGKQQVGYLSLLGDVLKHLGPQLVPFWPRLLGTTMELIHRAQSQLSSRKSEVAAEDQEDVEVDEEAATAVVEEDEDEDEDATTGGRTHHSAPLRTIRQLGLKRFGDFFRSAATFDFAPYLPAAFSSFIGPRLAALDKENTQAPSGLLELFAGWSSRRESIPFLVEYDGQVLEKIYDCLTATNVKPAVISKIYDIVERLLAFTAEEADPQGYVRQKVIQPYVDGLLANLAVLVERPVGLGPVKEELAKRQIRVLSGLAAFVTNGTQSGRLISLLSPMLRKPVKVVPEKVKVDILLIFKNLLPLVPEFSDPSTDFFLHNFNLLSTLFQLLRSRPARQALCEVFEQFALSDPTLRSVVDIAASLNSFSERRMEEPDFDRRLAAFATLNEELYLTLTVREWLPMLYNMLHHVQDPEELSIRANAAFSMRRFVEIVASKPNDEPFEGTFLRVLYPGLRNGLRSRIELVRTEILSVFASSIQLCTNLPLVQEMKSLLAGGDDEASFFTNIHHIQTHRRTRALRRLSELCDEGELRSSTLADIFLPLISHFITGASEKSDHHLVNEAILATGRISRQLAWGAYNSLVRQYIRLAKEKTEQEKFFIRTVVALLDNFHFAMEDAVVEEEVVVGDGDVDEAVGEVEVKSGEEIAAAEADVAAAGPVYPKTSQAVRIAEAVESRLLPSLLQYIEQKDETEDSIRIPIALGVVKVALNLPERSREAQISRLLTILSQVFRSKSQETRDLAKDTMIKIAVTLGPEWLAQVVREMKQALQRGPQLHVLAFTIHAILVHVTSLASEEFSDLDDCVVDVVNIAAEVIFGESGKDLQAEGFKTKMREVRTSTSKGLDTFQLVARLISPPKMSQLLLPLREVLQTTATLKVLQQADDVLRRIASGLNSNERLNPGELLVLVHTLVGQNAMFLKPKARSTKVERAKKSFHVDMKRSVAKDVDHYAANAHKFVAFGLELFVTGFRRGRFDFADSDILDRLEPLVNIIGNTLYAGDSQVVVLGCKSTAALVKCPIDTVATSLPTLVQQIFLIVKQSGGTESEVSQAALKTLAVILRDCKAVEINEKQLTYLLEVITPDLEDPSRQATLFALLRSIISRKFVVADIYDLMDKVSEVMVTSQSPHVQELCRISLMQFLLDYPQGKGRLKKQMQFLAKNLSYVYESGRLSVMELLSAVLHKFSVELVHEYSDLFFVGLVMVIANDDSVKCREMAAELVKNLLPRLDEEGISKTVATLHTWASQTSQPQLPRLASQVFGLVLDCLKADAYPYASLIRIDLQSILSLSATSLEAFETAQDDPSPFDMELDEDLDWQLPYQSLSTLAKLLKSFPELIPSIEWSPIIDHLLFPHAWVRLAAARLVGTLFGSMPPSFDLEHTSPSDDGPLQPRGLFDIARKSLLQLKGESIDEALAMQVVKNVVFLGRCFGMGPGLPFTPTVVEEVVEEEEEEDDGVPVVDENGEAIEEPEEKAPVDEDEEMSEEVATRRALENPLAWLFTKLSQSARHILITRPAVHGAVSPQRALPILSIFRLFAALASVLEPKRTEQFLMQILHPVQRVLDDDQKADEEMRNLATELQTLVQAKVGVSAFSSVWNSITRGRALKRQARRYERVVKTTTDPQFAAQRKQYKQDSKKESHKRKIHGFASTKLRERPTKLRRTRDPMTNDD